MDRVEVGDLAWALADAAKGFMASAERTAVCAKIGAGEPDLAIRDVLALYADTDAELPFEFATAVRRWIGGYEGSDIEPILLELYEGIRVSVMRVAGRQPTASEPDRSPRPLVAQRSECVVHSKYTGNADKQGDLLDSMKSYAEVVTDPVTSAMLPVRQRR